MPNHCQIAIIWASFAGLSAYVMLRKRLGKEADIKIFDMRDKFTYTPGLHECLWDQPRLERLQFDVKTYYPNEFIHAKVERVEWHHVLVTETGEEWSFDYAIIATGSQPQFFGNEMWKKHGYTIRYPEDITRLNTDIPNSERIAVIWWWITWVEVSSVLKQQRPEKHIMLIHSGNIVLNNAAWLYSCATAERYLREQWVELRYGERLQDIHENSIVLSDGQEIACDMTILSAGVTADDEPYRSRLSFENSYTSLESDNIYLAGDVAMHGLMPTAHNAFFEWRRMANLIADKILGEQKAYWPLHNWKNLAIALWTHDGLMTFWHRGIYLPGLTWFAKRLVEKRVFFEFKHKILLPI